MDHGYFQHLNHTEASHIQYNNTLKIVALITLYSDTYTNNRNSKNNNNVMTQNTLIKSKHDSAAWQTMNIGNQNQL